MNKVRNSEDFSYQLSGIYSEYQNQYKPSIDSLRRKYATSSAKESEIENLLEAHLRYYVVDRFLSALNWHFDSLVPEAPITSFNKDTTRFLDYLGMNEAMERALLIFETKKPDSKLPLPSGRRNNKLLNGETFPSLIISSLINNNNQLTEEGKDWIKTLKDYSLSINNKQGDFPRRVVITNGEWLIIFVDPEDSFSSVSPSPNKILVYQSWSDIENASNEVFKYLEYYNVVENIPCLDLGEINFYLNSNQVDKVMFGLKLLYIEEAGFYDTSPRIKVVPILFIRSTNGVWFQIDAKNPKYTKVIPTKLSELPDHLKDISNIANELLSKINTKLGLDLTCSSLNEHYSNPNLFEELAPVSRITSSNNISDELFLIATGENTHYLLDESTMPNCPYHNWDNCDEEGDAVENIIKRVQTSEPRTIFVDSTEYHCSHKEIHTAKSSKITIENQDRCGSRSGKEQEAFCEIWAFEQHLCCRTCAFEKVCTKADVFNCLPCKSI